MNSKINPFEIESLRLELEEKKQKSPSVLFKLFLLNQYFEKILSLDNQNYEAAFLTEFLQDYIGQIKKYEVWGTDPEISEEIIKVLNSVFEREFTTEYNLVLQAEIERLTKQFRELNRILSGENLSPEQTNKAYFPLIDNEANEYFYGLIDSVTISINRAAKSDNFIN